MGYVASLFLFYFLSGCVGVASLAMCNLDSGIDRAMEGDGALCEDNMEGMYDLQVVSNVRRCFIHSFVG